MTYREWPNPEDDLPRLAKSRLTTSRNLKSWFDEISSLKPSSRDEQFRPVISRNWYKCLNWLSGDWKTPVSRASSLCIYSGSNEPCLALSAQMAGQYLEEGFMRTFLLSRVSLIYFTAGKRSILLKSQTQILYKFSIKILWLLWGFF